MLKAIKKFVLDRRRDADAERRQVVAEDHPKAVGSVYQAHADVAEPPHEEPAAAPPVLAKVKWYDLSKHYGFVELSDGPATHSCMRRRSQASAPQPSVQETCSNYGLRFKSGVRR